MGQMWRVCAAFAAALIIAACGSSAAPRGTTRSPATASSSSKPVVFTSTHYPYSITLPAGWVATSATLTWDGSGSPAGDEAEVDKFNNVHLSGMAFGSAAPTKSDLSAWVADQIEKNFLVHGDRCPQTPNLVEPVTIGGQPGRLVAWNCDGTLINAVFTVVNGYGYRFVFRDPSIPAATDASDTATFMTMLRSVTFH